MKGQEEHKESIGYSMAAIALSLMLALIISFLGVPLLTPGVFGYNQTVSILTKVNITNSPPEVRYVMVFDDATFDNKVDLVAGSVKTVYCNATVYDDNGGTDVNTSSAVFYHNSVGLYNADDNNTHYTNSTCGDCSAIDADNATCSCSFQVYYYANNHTWTCNLTAYDKGGQGGNRILNGSNTSTAYINSLLSIDASPIIDFGNLTVGSTSEVITANVTNYGNVIINISIRGYGDNDEVLYNESAMHCNRGNIPSSYERYAILPDPVYTSMISITNASTVINGFALAKRTLPNDALNSTNQTYWRLQIPPGVAGSCNGTVIMTASQRI